MAGGTLRPDGWRHRTPYVFRGGIDNCWAKTMSIADALRVKIDRLGPVRARLIKKGMIYSPAHGDLAFTVPLFDEFMLRAIPVI